MIVFEPLAKSLLQLETHIGLANSDLAKGDPTIAFAFRTAAIQSFEYSYGLSVKLLERHLQEASDGAQEVEHMNFRTLIRTAAEKGLLDDPAAWFDMREMRNITAHTYDEVKAAEIFAVLPAFLRLAKQLFTRLADHAAVA